MQYRMYSPAGRRYAYSNPAWNLGNNSKENEDDLESLNKTIKIPAPNEPPEETEKHRKTARILKRRPFYQLGNIFKRIKSDELILLGLIFLLFNEKVEDDLLILVLIYILITGRE